MSYMDLLMGGEAAPAQKAVPAEAAPKPSYYADLVGETARAAPVAKEVPISKSSKAASVGDIAVASLATDPAAQIRYFAKQRGIPEDRYGIANGRIVYRDDDGKLYYEVPQAEFNIQRKDSIPSIVKELASGVGPAISPVASTAAGVLTAPMMLTGPGGMAASMGITAAAGGAAEAGRQALANKLMGQEFEPSRIAGETIAAGTGQAIGAGLSGVAQRGIVRDIGKLDRSGMAATEATAAKYGIPLTPAESSGLSSLAAQQKALGNLPATADTMKDFYGRRAGTIRTAVDDYFAKVSTVDSPELAGQMTVKAADDAITNAKRARSAAAREKYAFVDDPANIIPDEAFAAIKADEFTADLIQSIKSDKLYGMKAMPDNSLPVIDAAKKRFDDLIAAAERQGEGNRARLLTQKRDNLLEVADEAFPEYKIARDAFAGKSPEVDALEEGLTGVIAGLKDRNAQQAAEKLFSATSSGPEAVAKARAAINGTDPDAWQAIKRAWLQRQWEAAGKETLASGSEALNQGAKFRNLLLGDERKRQMMRAALSNDEWRTINELSEVLEAAGKVKPIGSDTAWNQEMMRLARQESTPVLAKMARALRPQDWGRLVEEWATERGLAKNAEKLAEVITQPGAGQKLKQIRQMNPNGARFKAALSQFLSQSGAFALGDAVDGEPLDRPVVPLR